MYQNRVPPEKPPCETCRVPTVEENIDALVVFFKVQRQFIVGAAGPIDINHLAIHAAMELYGIKDRRECFEKVLTLAAWWMKRISEERNEG